MTIFFLFTVSIWALALGAWWVLSRSRRRNDFDRMKERILNSGDKQERKARAAAALDLINKEDVMTGRVVLRLLNRFDLIPRLATMLEQAGLRWRPARVAHGCGALFLTGFFLARLVFQAPHVALQFLAGAVAGAVPILYVLHVRSRRLRKFEELFPESLEFVARSMRAGHAFTASLEMIYREFQEPLAGEFRRAFDEHNLGMPLDQALLKLAKRVPLLDVHFFVSAVLLQRRTGGNLAEILDKLAHIIRERFKLRGKIRAISAHGRMTGMALTAIPVAVGLLMFYVNPGYIRFFIEDEVGRWMALAAVLLQLAGYGVIRKIVSIEV